MIVATAAGGALAYAGKSEPLDAERMRLGGACDAPEFNFESVLVANEARYRAKATRTNPTLGASNAPAAASFSSTDAKKRGDSLFDASDFQAGAVPWLCVAFVGSFFLGLAMLWMFRQCAHTMVWSVIYMKVGVMAAVSLMFASVGAVVPFVVFTLLTLLSAFCFYLWTDELNLIASMLSVSTQGLRDNPHIVTTTVGLSFASLLYIFPAVAAMMFAAMNGRVTVSDRRRLATRRPRRAPTSRETPRTAAGSPWTRGCHCT